jgi:hypothetical protein
MDSFVGHIVLQLEVGGEPNNNCDIVAIIQAE